MRIQKRFQIKIIDDNKNICRPTLVSYVIHYSILIYYYTLIFYFNNILFYFNFNKKKDFLYHSKSNEPFI